MSNSSTVVTIRGMKATEEGKPASVKVSFQVKKTGKASKYSYVSKVNVVEEKKKDTFEMTSLVATSANELTATFASTVEKTDAITIKVNKAGSTTAITGTTKWTNDTTAVFTASAKLTAGTYEMTATDSADATKTTSKSVVVESEKVAEIVILNDIALTGASNPNNGTKDQAFIYYDVYNQYGESLRNSTSITWTVSSDQNPTINKATGKITANTTAQGGYVYGSSIYITGVYTKTGVTVQKELKVGMEQSLDTVKSCGFLKMTDKNKILDKLPTNFQANQYVLLYQMFDQNGNQLDATKPNITGTSPKVTFISDNVLLIKNDFKDGDIYTIDGVEYCSATIQPGQYVDKGGEVNITAISNKTGNKTVMNYLVGAAAILHSVVLSQPSEIVADGETHEIPFVATDVAGNQITNYESIARTTNSLNLTASEGELWVEEKNDGTAKFVFDDKSVSWGDATTWDDVSRSVALTTVVVGGESNNLILSVDDKARPVAVKEVTFRDKATTAIVENDTDTVKYDRFTFVDQYGRTIDPDKNDRSNGFFAYLSGHASKWHDNYYGIKAEFAKVDSAFNTPGTTKSADGAILLNATTAINTGFTWSALTSGEVKNETIKWSIASTDKSTTDADEYNYCDKALNVSYSVVPMKRITSLAINETKKQYVSLGLEDYKTAAEASYKADDLAKTIKNIAALDNVACVKSGYEQQLGVSGMYKGIKVVVPADYIKWESKVFEFNVTPGAIDGVSTAALKLGDFYSATAANLARKDGSADVTATIYTTVNAGDQSVDKQMAAPTTKVAFSDEGPAAAKIELVGESCTVNPWFTQLGDGTLRFDYDSNGDGTNDNFTTTTITHSLTHHNAAYDTTKKCTTTPRVFDQYGKVMTTDPAKWVYTVSDIVESTNELTHLDNSFVVSANATAAPIIDGAEIGDTFQLTYKYGGATASIKLTVGADDRAFVSSYGDADKFFRQHVLDYAY